MALEFPTRFELHQVFKDPRNVGTYWSREYESFATKELAEKAAKTDLKDVTWVIFKKEQVACSKLKGV